MKSLRSHGRRIQELFSGIRVSGVALFLLLAVSPLFGQSYAIDQDGVVEIQDRNAVRGTLHYEVFVDGGTKIGENEFEFDKISDARLRITFRVDGKNDKWTRRMRVGISPTAFREHTASLWRPYATTSFLIGPDDGTKSVSFAPKSDGTSNLRLTFAFLDTDDEDWENMANWKPPGAGNMIRTSIVTIREKEKREVTAEDVKGDLKAMFAFYTNQEKPKVERDKVEEMIRATANKDFKRLVLHDKEIPTSQAFVNQYKPYVGKGIEEVDGYVRSTEINIAEWREELGGDDDEEDEDRETIVRYSEEELRRRELRDLLRNRDTARLSVFLTANENSLNREEVANALDSITCWTDASYELLGKKDGREIIKLHGFVSPAYYDVYQDWIEIDDERLQNERILSIAIHRSEKLKLEIVDRTCPDKKIEIALDNLMRAELTVDSVRGLYHITFEGGNKPYMLRIYSDSTEGSTWSRQGIMESRITLQVDSLQAFGLSGNFQAEAYSMGSDNPVVVAGGMIFIPDPSRPAWILPFLIILAVGGLAILILYILRRSRRGRADIFSEA